MKPRLPCQVKEASVFVEKSRLELQRSVEANPFRVIASIRNIAENGGKQGLCREDKNSVFDWKNEGLIKIFQEITEKFE